MTELRGFVPKFLPLYHLVVAAKVAEASVRECLVVGISEIGRILVAAQ